MDTRKMGCLQAHGCLSSHSFVFRELVTKLLHCCLASHSHDALKKEMLCPVGFHSHRSHSNTEAEVRGQRGKEKERPEVHVVIKQSKVGGKE